MATVHSSHVFLCRTPHFIHSSCLWVRNTIKNNRPLCTGTKGLGVPYNKRFRRTIGSLTSGNKGKFLLLHFNWIPATDVSSDPENAPQDHIRTGTSSRLYLSLLVFSFAVTVILLASNCVRYLWTALQTPSTLASRDKNKVLFYAMLLGRHVLLSTSRPLWFCNPHLLLIDIMDAYLRSDLQWSVSMLAPSSAIWFVFENAIFAREGVDPIVVHEHSSPKRICCNLHRPKRELVSSSLLPPFRSHIECSTFAYRKVFIERQYTLCTAFSW